MEYIAKNKKIKISNRALPLTGGVKLTDGRLKELFDNNIDFLHRFDVDRMMYWFRVNAGRPAPNAPYASGGGHFEDNLYGQTAGMFLMCASTALMWQDDEELRQKINAIVDEIAEYVPEDGCFIPVEKERRFTLEYPNYVRAWLTFGLLAAGYIGNKKAFELARTLGDWFNNAPELPKVKDMNLGFQGILCNTELYLSPVGNDADLDVAQKYYREEYYLEHLKNKDSDAMYRHSNHPHGTVLTAIEGYLDIYRITGEEKLLECVKNALEMVEKDWQHVGGGIVMCEQTDFPHYPGCNFVGKTYDYNELCCTTFWILLNQRMALLDPDNAHYYDQIEDSMYNIVVASQVEDRGYHYLNRLEKAKDYRCVDIATCCAATGSRLVSMLPQFLYSYNDDTVYVNLYTSSTADIDGTEIEVKTNLPYEGKVSIKIIKWNRKSLKLRIPNWAGSPVTVNGVTANPGEFLTLNDVSEGMELEMDFEFKVRATLYTGAEVIEGKERYAYQYGPILLATARYQHAKLVCPDPENVTIKKADGGRYIIDDNVQLEMIPYMDIAEESFMVYPIVER